MQCMQAIVLKKQIYRTVNVNHSQIVGFFIKKFLIYLRERGVFLLNPLI
jgi:hypothetical protein